MKISSLFFLLAGSFFFARASASTCDIREIYVRVVFPDGDDALTDQESAEFQVALEGWYNQTEQRRHRKLRSQQDHRALANCPSLCSGFTCKKCWVVHKGCRGWCGRRLEEEEEQQQQQKEEKHVQSLHTRELTASGWESKECLDQIEDVKSIFISNVASDKINRADFTCYELFDEGCEMPTCQGIISYDILDHFTGEKTHLDFLHGADVCESRMRNINIQATVDPDCDVKRVRFNFKGPDKYEYQKKDFDAPYWLFRDDEGSNMLLPGVYLLRAGVKLANGKLLEENKKVRVKVRPGC